MACKACRDALVADAQNTATHWRMEAERIRRMWKGEYKALVARNRELERRYLEAREDTALRTLLSQVRKVVWAWKYSGPRSKAFLARMRELEKHG